MKTKTKTHINTFEIIAEPGDAPLLTMPLLQIRDLIGDIQCDHTVLVEEGFRFSFATNLIRLFASIEAQTTTTDQSDQQPA